MLVLSSAQVATLNPVMKGHMESVCPGQGWLRRNHPTWWRRKSYLMKIDRKGVADAEKRRAGRCKQIGGKAQKRDVGY